MIKIIDITVDGKITFKANEDLHNVTIIIKDYNFNGNILRQYFEIIKKEGNYFLSISSVLVPHLKNTYIEINDNNKLLTIDFKFPSNLLKGYSLYGNSCVCWRTYEAFNSVYNSPTISNLILDDKMYVQFCEHVDSYLDTNITFGNVRSNQNFKNQYGTERVVNPNVPIDRDYPITHHFDLDIHWIHTKRRELEFGDSTYFFKEVSSNKIPQEEFREKWIRRVQRGKGTTKIFLWSSSEFFNVHGDWERKQLINRFKKLPNRSILLTERPEEEFEDDLHIVKYISDWKDNHQLQRDKFGGIIWNNQLENSKIFKKIIEEKFL